MAAGIKSPQAIEIRGFTGQRGIRKSFHIGTHHRNVSVGAVQAGLALDLKTGFIRGAIFPRQIKLPITDRGDRQALRLCRRIRQRFRCCFIRITRHAAAIEGANSIIIASVRGEGSIRKSCGVGAERRHLYVGFRHRKLALNSETDFVVGVIQPGEANFGIAEWRSHQASRFGRRKGQSPRAGFIGIIRFAAKIKRTNPIKIIRVTF